MSLWNQYTASGIRDPVMRRERMARMGITADSTPLERWVALLRHECLERGCLGYPEFTAPIPHHGEMVQLSCLDPEKTIAELANEGARALVRAFNKARTGWKAWMLSDGELTFSERHKPLTSRPKSLS